jgi:hypothetical protein
MLNVAGNSIFVPQSPIVLISVDVNLEAAADLTNSDVLAQLGVSMGLPHSLPDSKDCWFHRNRTPVLRT